jgi:ABC-type uncharacterized transport system permease subunit
MNKRQSLFHIAKRDTLPWYQAVLIRGGAIVLALIVCAIVTTLLTGENPLNVYSTILYGAFGTPRKSWVTFHNLAILLGISLAVTPAFKMRFWNIGAEGQVLIGCLATAACMICLGGKLPNAALILVMIVAAIAAGALWGFLPAIFKAKWNTNETLFTLMMNYIAIQLTSFAVSKWENPPGSNSIGTINSKGDVKYVGWIGNMFSDGYNKDFMWTVIVVLVLATLVYLYLKYTKHGYEIAVVGDSENTARYAGIRVPRIYVRTMALSGALCGFAGFLAVSAVSHTLSTETAGGRGFTAIIVAWLAKMNPFVMILISALLSFLDKGAVQIASDFGLNEYVSQIISGVILFFILGSEFFINYQVKAGGKHK